MSVSRRIVFPLAAIGTALAVTPAWAHSADGGASLFAGLVHPIFGVDHLLAMVAVGTLAALRGGIGRWGLPVLFVVGLVAGALFGGQLSPLPWLELAIATSLLALGGTLWRPQLLPGAAVSLGVAALALVHGYAHGSEAPVTGAFAFFIGMAVSTGVLLVLGNLAVRFAGHIWPGRVVGLVAAAAGSALLMTA